MSGAFLFGPFRLDVRTKALLRDGEPQLLSPREFDVLHELVVHAGRIVSKKILIEAAWPGVSVGHSNLEKVIGHLRQRLDPAALDRYIETVPRRGYRFIAAVEAIHTGVTDAERRARNMPFRVLMEGRATLETLRRAQIAEARELFGHLVLQHPDEAGFHIAYANACILAYESTRADAAPDAAALQCAVEHAQTACRLEPGSAEALATLGFVMARTDEWAEALGHLRQATAIQPGDWRHHFRLAAVSWGEVRRGAAERTLAIRQRYPLARLLVAILFVARDQLADAEHEIDTGLAVMPAEANASARYLPVALHWLKGLLCLARGADDEALAAFDRELALEPQDHIYARECCANTWYAIGACRLRRGDHAAARAAFEQAIARVSIHPMAHVGLRLLAGDRGADGPAGALSAVESGLCRGGDINVAVARAALLVADGDAPAAARVVAAALAAAPPGNAGWLVPIEPLLGVQRDRAVWGAVLAVLEDRAS